MCAGGDGMSRSRVKAVTLLPQPDSPTNPSVSPLFKRKADPVDGLDRAFQGVKVDPQVLYFQNLMTVSNSASQMNSISDTACTNTIILGHFKL